MGGLEMEQDIKNAPFSNPGTKMKFNEVVDKFFEGKTIKNGCFTYKKVPLDNGDKDDIIIITCHKRDGSVETFYNDISDAFISATDLLSDDWEIDEIF